MTSVFLNTKTHSKENLTWQHRVVARILLPSHQGQGQGHALPEDEPVHHLMELTKTLKAPQQWLEIHQTQLVGLWVLAVKIQITMMKFLLEMSIQRSQRLLISIYSFIVHTASTLSFTHLLDTSSKDANPNGKCQSFYHDLLAQI